MSIRLSYILLVLFCSVLFILPSQVRAKEFPAPSFDLPTLAGDSLALEQFKNQNPVLLVFWATWCPGCIREIPNINDLVEKYETQGLVTIGVNIGEPVARVKRFSEKYEPRYPLALDQERDVSKRYRIRGVPTMLVIDKNGQIIYASYSINERLQHAVETALEG